MKSLTEYISESVKYKLESQFTAGEGPDAKQYSVLGWSTERWIRITYAEKRHSSTPMVIDVPTAKFINFLKSVRKCQQITIDLPKKVIDKSGVASTWTVRNLSYNTENNFVVYHAIDSNGTEHDIHIPLEVFDIELK